jgi:hypothetical protein
MYRNWKNDPSSVHVSWATYFNGLDKGMPSPSAYTPPPGFIGAASSVPLPTDGSPAMDVKGAGNVTDYLKAYYVNFIDDRYSSLFERIKYEDIILPTSILYISTTRILIPGSHLN